MKFAHVADMLRLTLTNAPKADRIRLLSSLREYAKVYHGTWRALMKTSAFQAIVQAIIDAAEAE